jgi:hypothetical protein
MPYRKMALKAVPKAVLRGERLDQPPECPEDVFQIMTKYVECLECSGWASGRLESALETVQRL